MKPRKETMMYHHSKPSKRTMRDTTTSNNDNDDNNGISISNRCCRNDRTKSSSLSSSKCDRNKLTAAGSGCAGSKVLLIVLISFLFCMETAVGAVRGGGDVHHVVSTSTYTSPRTRQRRLMKTPEPTTMPSEEPSESSFPSSEPTGTPTTSPTPEPTGSPTTPLPTTSPSASPTPEPTTSPTPNPTTSEPTQTPTQSPITSTMNPTNTATEDDVEENNNDSDEEEELIAVSLPTVGIDLVVTDDDAALDFDVNLLTIFVGNILDVNSGVDTFDHVTLVYDVIQSEFDRDRNRKERGRGLRRRKLEAGISVQMVGQAYFQEEEVPSEDSLAQTLRAYFSFWGDHDLEAYLKAVGLPSVVVASVRVDGETVEKIGAEGEENNMHNRPGAALEDPTKTKKKIEQITFTPGIIGGLAAGAFVVLLAITYFVCQCRKSSPPASRRGDGGGGGSISSRKKKKVSSKHLRQQEQLTSISTGRIGASPNPSSSTPTTQQSYTYGQQWGAGYDDAISIDMSLYTTDDASISTRGQRNIVSATYDPSRLDRVIAAAKQNSSSATSSTKQNSSAVGSGSSPVQDE